MMVLSIRRVSPTRAATAINTRPLTFVIGWKLSGSTSARYSGSTSAIAARARAALQHVAEALDADGGREARGIDRLDRGGEQHVDPERGRLGGVLDLVAR